MALRPWSYVKAYTFNLFPAQDAVQLRILENGVWSKHVHSEVLVGHSQALKVVELVNSTRGSFSKYPFPRHAFVFFNGRDEPIGSVDVCFECDDLFPWPDFTIGDGIKYGIYDEDGRKGEFWTEFEAALPAYASIFKELGLPL
ncbi:hypothetical protein [Hyphomicrobium sp.]|uniref:hypothetical protein n=1 Tax=Hyphomicrobium sp. TaxID=82 RepID=UPI0025BB8A9B|nr:hypothetical protein [Hyphomicrobium sp.]MCC7252028.1 hypothetical protein [Hyphomicrobium sp.]